MKKVATVTAAERNLGSCSVDRRQHRRRRFLHKPVQVETVTKRGTLRTTTTAAASY